jgi:transcription-repair coupling factor (superfamily II helicase)
VNTLLLVVRIKAMCRRAGVGRLDAGPKGATVVFHGDRFASPAGLVEYIQAQNGQARIKDNKLIVLRDWPTEADRIKGGFAIVKELAEKVAEVTPAKAKPKAAASGEKPKAAPVGDAAPGGAKVRGR